MRISHCNIWITMFVCTQTLTKYSLHIHDLPRPTMQLCWLFFFVAQQLNSDLGHPHCWGFWITNTIRHTSHPAELLNVWSASRRGRYLHNTQQTQETNIHAFSGIRTPDPSNSRAADRRLRSHGHRHSWQETYSVQNAYSTPNEVINT